MKTYVLDAKDVVVVAAMAKRANNEQGQLCLQFRKDVADWNDDRTIEKRLVLALSRFTSIYQTDDKGCYGGAVNPDQRKLKRIFFEFED